MARLEIRELIIKATIVPDGATNAANGQPAQAASTSNNDVSPGEEMINICVEKVLEIIKDKHGR